MDYKHLVLASIATINLAAWMLVFFNKKILNFLIGKKDNKEIENSKLKETTKGTRVDIIRYKNFRWEEFSAFWNGIENDCAILYFQNQKGKDVNYKIKIKGCTVINKDTGELIF